MSYYSNKLDNIDEPTILKNIGIGSTLTGDHSMIDDLYVAWQFTEDFRKTEFSPYMAESEDRIMEAVKGIIGDAESLITGIEDPAMMQGFSLGVQFAIAAMKNDGAIWKLLTQAGAAEGLDSNT